MQCSYSCYSDWSVLSELYGSDHFLIIIKWYYHLLWGYYTRNTGEISNLLTEDYTCQFINNRMNKTINMRLHVNTNVSIEKFIHIMLNAANNCIPKTQTRRYKKQVPWQNSDCQKAVKANKRAFNHFKQQLIFENKLVENQHSKDSKFSLEKLLKRV